MSAISAKQEANHDRAAIHSHGQKASLHRDARNPAQRFHDVSVWGVRAALEAAYKAGANAERNAFRRSTITVLEKRIEKAGDLYAAIDGVTDQFDDELRALSRPTPLLNLQTNSGGVHDRHRPFRATRRYPRWKEIRVKGEEFTVMDIAAVDHLLTTTRSVRKRLDLSRPLEPEILERCIEIAMQAPTALYGQTWHFVVVTDPARKQDIAEIYRRVTREYRSGVTVPDRYLSQLHFIKDPGDPRFGPHPRLTLPRIFTKCRSLSFPALKAGWKTKDLRRTDRVLWRGDAQS